MKIKDFFESFWKQRIFGLFFLIAFLLWYIAKLSGQYTTDIPIPIELITDGESNRYIEDPNIKVKVNCQSDGRTILSYRWNTATSIQIPISKIVLEKISKYNYLIDNESLARAIQAQLKDVNINYISDTTQIVRIAKSSSKIVPILADFNISYASQHMNPKGNVILGFDSVEINAPNMILDTINFIKTAHATYVNLNHPIKSNISLMIPEKVICEKRTIPYEIPVERCTQYKFTIDVAPSKPTSRRNIFRQIINNKNSYLTMIPQQVTIFLNMPLSAEAQKNEIRAYIDYKENENKTDYQVMLDKLPSGSEIVAIEPNHIKVYRNLE